LTFEAKVWLLRQGRARCVARGGLKLLFGATTINSVTKLTCDPDKDDANIIKHGLSLTDALLVFDAPDKLTLKSPKGDEARLMDVAMVALAGVVLVLVYVMRQPNEVRAISLHRASKQERTLYAKNINQANRH